MYGIDEVNNMKNIYLTQNNRVLCFTHSIDDVLAFLDVMEMVIIGIQIRRADTIIMEVH